MSGRRRADMLLNQKKMEVEKLPLKRRGGRILSNHRLDSRLLQMQTEQMLRHLIVCLSDCIPVSLSPIIKNISYRAMVYGTETIPA